MKQAARKKFHYIYKITRVDTGRYYIGMHSTDNLDDGYFGSGKIITRSLKKYGKDKHVKEILEQLPNREALKLREKELVCEELLGDKLCMNLKLGGEGGGGFWSKDQQKNATVASNKSPNRKKEQYAKGAETRRKNGTAPKWTFFSGMLGKKHTAESKQRMAESQTGDKNGSFGTKWMIKDDLKLKVSMKDVEKFLAQGFRLGRK